MCAMPPANFEGDPPGLVQMLWDPEGPEGTNACWGGGSQSSLYPHPCMPLLARACPGRQGVERTGPRF